MDDEPVSPSQSFPPPHAARIMSGESLPDPRTDLIMSEPSSRTPSRPAKKVSLAEPATSPSPTRSRSRGIGRFSLSEPRPSHSEARGSMQSQRPPRMSMQIVRPTDTDEPPYTQLIDPRRPSDAALITSSPAVEMHGIPVVDAPNPPAAFDPSGPPSLQYTLHTRKKSIFYFWFLILFDSIAVPIALYFGLWYGTDLSPNAVFSISTACLGGTSIFEYILRFWRLWKKNSTCRVLGARRAYLDWFHWNFSCAWFFIMLELIIGTVFDDPPIRLLAMPVSSLLFWFAFQLITEDTLRLLGKRSPVRISSMPKGALFRPGIYSIIEDVVAVDGSGGTEFRGRLNDRFEASFIFRQMLHRLTLFWAFGALFAAILTTILVFTLDRDPAYVVGWVLPFLWAGIWTWATFWYVKRELKVEKEMWGQKIGNAQELKV